MVEDAGQIFLDKVGMPMALMISIIGIIGVIIKQMILALKMVFKRELKLLKN